MHKAARLAVALAVLLTLAVAGWGPAQPAAADSADVGMVVFRFVPPTVTVAAGDSVTWSHRDPVAARPHTSTSDPGQAEHWDSGALTGGGTFAYTFTVPGTYSYYCAIVNHRQLGMEGQVTVGPATAASVCGLTKRSVTDPVLAASMCRLLEAIATRPSGRPQWLAAYARLVAAGQRSRALTPAAAATLVRLARTL